MSRISTYTANPLPQLDDKLIGTRVTGLPENNTMNFTLQAVLDLFIASGGSSLNIYNIDGTLNGNRFVTMGDYSLSFEKDLIVNTLTIGKGGGNIVSNTAFGQNSLYSNTVGTGNTSIGYGSMYSNVAGVDNTSIGSLSLLNNFDGIGNTAIGSSALYSNISGSSNIAIGFYSMYYNDSGNYNTSIGNYSLFYNTYGVGNVSIGYTSLNQNTTGSYNIAMGFQAMFSNTVGSNNIAIGYNALISQDADDSIAIGNNSLKYNYNGLYNVALGNYSLYTNYNGSFNVAIGQESLYSSNDSASTVALGYQSLYSLYSGNNNVGIGVSSLYYLNYGGDNIGVGWQSLFNLTEGYQNIGIGSNTTLNNDLDFNSIVIGYNAVGIGSNTIVFGNASITKTILRGNVGIGTTNPTFILHVVGSDVSINTLKIGLGGGQLSTNISIGTTSIGESGVGNTGNYQLAIGYRALRYNTSGRANVAIGNESLSVNTTGAYNTALSVQTLLRNTTGNNNTAVGLYSYLWNTTGSNNVAVGFQSGNSVNGTFGSGSGSYNIFLGSENYAGITTGSYNVIIGSQVTGLPSSTANNIVIADGQGNIRFRDNGVNTILSRLVGTGTRMVVANAAGELSTQAIGSGSVTGSGTTNYVPKWTSSSAIGDSLIFDNGVGVGIGTNSADFTTYKLNVNGNVYASGFINTNTLFATTTATNEIKPQYPNPTLAFNTTGGTRSLTMYDSSGDIFIGLSPVQNGYKFSVNGTGKFTDTLSIITTYNSQILAYTTVAGGGKIIQGTNGGYTFSIDGANGGGPRLGLSSSNSSIYDFFELGAFSGANNFATKTRNFRILSTISTVEDARFQIFANSGNVVIQNGGTFSDNGYRLQVSGTAKFGTGNTIVTIENNAIVGRGAVGFNDFYVSGASVTIVTGSETYFSKFDSNGNLGIGTTSPAYKLDVNGSSRFNDTLLINKTTDAIFRLRGGTYSGQYDTTIRAMSGAQGILQLGNNDINYIIAGNNTAGGYLVFRINATGENITSGTEAMRISPNGNLLVGRTTEVNTTYKLQIGGSTIISGSLSVGPTANYGPFIGGILADQAASRFLEINILQAGKLSFNDGNSYIKGGSEGGVDFISFFTQNINRLFISNGGNVGIGVTTDLGYKLYVNGSGWFNSDIYVRKPSNTTCYIYVGDTTNSYSLLEFRQATNFYTIGAKPGGAFSFTNGFNNNDVFSLFSDATVTLTIGAGNRANFTGKVGIGGYGNIYTLPNMLTVIGNTSIGTTEALSTANAASVLFSVNSTTKGVLLPKLTTAQILAITPATGLLLYNSDDNVYGFYNGTEWRKFTDELMFP